MTRTFTLTADQHAALVEVLTSSREDWSLGETLDAFVKGER